MVVKVKRKGKYNGNWQFAGKSDYGCSSVSERDRERPTTE